MPFATVERRPTAYHRGTLKTDPPSRGQRPRLRRLLAAGAALYLGSIWLDAAGVPLQKVLPRPLAYFTEVARLFPYAVPLITEYRVEGYFCAQRAWRELDVRPFFPLRADDKESRFDRAMFFYRHEPMVMGALDDYLVAANEAGPTPIGGVLLLSLRIPFAPPGGVMSRYQRRPLADYPAADRKYWYRTATPELGERCRRQLDTRGRPTP